MNLLGIDVGTTGCKVALFSPEGEMLTSAYREYDADRPELGWAQLDARSIWMRIQDAIRQVVGAVSDASVRAVSVSSLGEAVVPVSADRQILGPSLLHFDERGEAFLPELSSQLPDERLYTINGNTLGNHYSLTKLKWIQSHQPELYRRTYKFLHWGAFIGFMLGAEAVVDYSLANRTLLFDIRTCDWSDTLLDDVGLDRDKLPETAPSGEVVGTISSAMADKLGLSRGVKIVSGAHDQCANAVGCGVLDPGNAVYGMGTFHCITPVFKDPPDAQAMISRGLNTEHHAVPDRYVSFIYNQGGSLVKWYRDTFAAVEHRQAEAEGRSVYPALFAEIPSDPSGVMVLPHFTTTGPPAFISDSSGVIAGLRLETERGEILRSLIEGAAFYLKEIVDSLPDTGIRAENFRAVGGGSQSDAWVQTCADIFGQPFTRPAITEAGALGAAIMAGVGAGAFDSYTQGVDAMVKLERSFEPNPDRHARYEERYALYQRLWPLMDSYLRDLSADNDRLG